ncbi:zf-HC2 domain-containing protein [Mycobacterium sp. 155]|uniref:zf-HC2 domain-containing protein n=1 Tax=Mycobacterium sp. 155 TaxID=1157943 RepID=UPI000364E2C9|nr:zf-HC2 domain-containing protein [Mycobacterium sp. 155]
MNCEVAREALSARLDGEREPVPSARVDEHLRECAECRAWRDAVTDQALDLRRLAERRPTLTALEHSVEHPRRPRLGWRRGALFAVGVVQILLAAVQGLGLSVGLAHGHGMGNGHLLNESTAWSAALGAVMIGAALRPVAAAGLAGVLGVFAAVLTVYVAVDATMGAVTPVRMLTHLPVLLGAILAVLVWRDSSAPGPEPGQHAAETDITLPHNASRGRRRGHLWPTDGSAA